MVEEPRFSRFQVDVPQYGKSTYICHVFNLTGMKWIQIQDEVALRGPVIITAVVILITCGYGLGVFAAMANKPTPTIQGAVISTDGSLCSINFTSPSSVDVHLSLVTLRYSDPAGVALAISFPSSQSITHGGQTTFSCGLGTPNQFLPSVSGMSGQSYNITARFDDGTSTTFASVFK